MVEMSGVAPAAPTPPERFQQNVETKAHELRQILGHFVHQLNELNPSNLENPQYLQGVADSIQKIHKLTSGG
jgi:hypothetical protein